jgi:hypothetical protein
MLAGILLATNPMLADTMLMLPGERRGVEMKQMAIQFGTAHPSGAEFAYLVQIVNKTRRELMDVELVFEVVRAGRDVVYSVSVPLKKYFKNVGVPHDGTMLPSLRTRFFEVKVTTPRKFYTSADTRRLRLGRIHVWDGRTNLRDPGHLFSMMCATENPKIIQTFAADKSLLKVRSKCGITPALMAFMAGDPSVVKAFQGWGANVKDKTTLGHNAMFFAAMGGLPSQMELAKSLGFGVNDRTKAKATPILGAIFEGRLTSVNWLLAHGADPNAADSTGTTPLLQSVSAGFDQAFTALIAHKANIKCRDNAGYGPMHYGVWYPNFMPLIKKAGASVNDVNPKTGETPLIYGNLLLAMPGTMWLGANGANLYVKDKRGYTADDYYKMLRGQYKGK